MSTKAQHVLAPNDYSGPADDFGVREFDCSGTSQANVIPEGWSNNYVNLYSATGCRFAFSKSSTAVVNGTPTATAAGTSSQVGGVLAAGERRNVFIPQVSPDQRVYFVRAGAVGAVTLELSSK